MFSLIHIIDGAVLLSFLIALRAIRRCRRTRGFPYPPGPPRWPLIGNFLDIPSTYQWLAFTKYSKKYGMPALSTRAFFLRLGGRAHYVLPLSRKRSRRLEQRQCDQGFARKTWECLLRPCRDAIPRYVGFVLCTLVVIWLTCSAQDGMALANTDSKIWRGLAPRT